MKKGSKKTKAKKPLGELLWNFWKHNYVWIIMLALVAIRIGIGYGMGAWYGMSEVYDDVAMVQGLSLKRLIQPTNLALIKHLGFSLFLGLTAISNLPYTVVLSCFWALSAFSVWLLVRKVTDKKWVQLLAFAYVLFLPIAFTSWGGVRVYRNAIIAPSIIMLFSFVLMLIIDLVRQEKLKKTIWTAIVTGVLFGFTYFLKEDGIWLKACMLLALLVCLLIIGYRLFKKKIKGKFQIKKAIIWTAISLIPFTVLFVWDNVYRGVNYAFFGVYEINTRTEGELGKFVENIYKIDSPNRTQVVWAPYDAIQAAFEASPTLGSYPKLLEEIMTTGWNKGSIIEHPIGRDYLTWIMRSELQDAGMWTSEKDVNDLFKQVNSELTAAFKDGTLKKAEGRIQLLASTGGYTWSEIMDSDLFPQMWKSFINANWLVEYDIGFSDGEIAYGTKGKEWDYTGINKVLHMNDLNIIEGKKRDIAHGAASVIYVIYRIVNTIILVVAVVFCGWLLIDIIKNWKKRRDYFRKNKLVISCAAVGIIFAGIGLAYSFATAWFLINPTGADAWAPGWYIFQGVGIPGILTMVYIPMIVGGVQFLGPKIKCKVSKRK